MTDDRLAILKGALDVLVLKALSWGPMYGYAVSYWIRSVTDEALELQEGVLYPALHRLERKGWIDSEWGSSENNRRAKYYSLTRLGRKQLQLELSTWERFASAVMRRSSAFSRQVAKGRQEVAKKTTWRPPVFPLRLRVKRGDAPRTAESSPAV